MDPNETLDLIWDLLFNVRDGGSHYDECIEALTNLAEWMAKGGACPYDDHWSDTLIGAYWFAVDNHSGQGSELYRLSCITGETYHPSPSCSERNEDGPLSVYQALNDLS